MSQLSGEGGDGGDLGSEQVMELLNSAQHDSGSDAGKLESLRKV